jgi:dTDP-4-dehydrorhamnose reductase
LKIKLPVVWVTGADGQLGQCLQSLAGRLPQYHFVFTNRAQLSIDDPTAINAFFAQTPIAWCINSAAYTAVDKAETDVETAMRINGTAVGYLADACQRNGAWFVHISTDYVFNGQATIPYTEADAVDPVNQYGASKLLGEQMAIMAHPDSIIIRTSWVYAANGHNFVKTMLRLMSQKESISVVNDQWGRPTYAMDLAAAILHIIQQPHPQPGIYHYSNSGEPITWYDFALAIKAFTNSACAVLPTTTAGYPTPAKRPAYSVLDTSAIENQFQLAIPHWKDSLEACLGELG